MSLHIHNELIQIYLKDEFRRVVKKILPNKQIKLLSQESTPGEFDFIEHRHSGINYVTPASKHRDEDFEILAKRKEVLRQAKAKNPAR